MSYLPSRRSFQRQPIVGPKRCSNRGKYFKDK